MLHKRLLAPLLATALAAPALAQVSPESSASLAAVIAARSDQERARDGARHPQATLEFFQVEPGMTVAEVLPGGGWYTRILAPYLGGEGTLYGVNYADRMWSMFGFATDDWIAERVASTGAFPEMVVGFTDNNGRASCRERV